MKKIKKPLSVLLAVMMLFVLASCITETPAASGDAGSSSAASSAVESNADSSTSDDPAVSDDAVAAIKEKGKVVMVTNAEFEPFEYKENDEIVGIDAEIAQKIAEKLGVELEITDIAFDS